MGWRDNWYPVTIAALIKLRGEGAPDKAGNRVPLLRASDLIPVLATVTDPLARAIITFQTSQSNQELGGAVMPVTALDGAGRLLKGAFGAPAYLGQTLITVRSYLAGKPDDETKPWQRSPSGNKPLYSVWVPNSILGEELALLGFHRQAVADFQRCVDVSSDMIRDYGTNLDRELASWRVHDFCAALRALASDLDVIAESPPVQAMDAVIGGLKHAMDRSAEVIGSGAAHIAEMAGNVAGHAAKGFLDTANMTALVVAGIAVYLLVQ